MVSGTKYERGSFQLEKKCSGADPYCHDREKNRTSGPEALNSINGRGTIRIQSRNLSFTTVLSE